MTSATDVAVVGGGITGLAAAWELAGPRGGHRPVRVTVLEAGAHLGGRIDTLDLGGRPVDAGASRDVRREGTRAMGADRARDEHRALSHNRCWFSRD